VGAIPLTDDPLLSLMFAERMFATIAGLAAKADLVWGLELLIGFGAGSRPMRTRFSSPAASVVENKAAARRFGVSVASAVP
jgi:hypothetical protein